MNLRQTNSIITDIISDILGYPHVLNYISIITMESSININAI